MEFWAYLEAIHVKMLPYFLQCIPIKISHLLPVFHRVNDVEILSPLRCLMCKQWRVLAVTCKQLETSHPTPPHQNKESFVWLLHGNPFFEEKTVRDCNLQFASNVVRPPNIESETENKVSMMVAHHPTVRSRSPCLCNLLSEVKHGSLNFQASARYDVFSAMPPLIDVI